MDKSSLCGSQGFLAALLALAVLVLSSSQLFADAIHDAAAKGDVAAIEKLLAANPAALNSRGDVYMQEVDTHATGTALNVAVMHNQKDAVKLLLAKGADVNSKSNAGNTPLHMAAWRAYKDILEILLGAKGADVNAKNSTGKTPLQMAIETFPNSARPSNTARAAVVELLLKKGANPNLKDSSGASAMQVATEDDDVELKAVFQKNGFKMAVAAPVVPVAAPKGAFVVPFRDKPVILVQGKINGKTFTLGFDTGASHTVLSPETAQATGVRANGQFGTADISAGDAVLKGQRVAVQAMPQFAQFRQLGVNVAGILGFPYLSQFVITFDYKTKQLTLVPANGAPPLKEEGGSHVVTFTQLPVYGLIFVQAKVNGGQPMTFLFDSGAEETILTPATARKLGIKGGPAQPTSVGMVSKATANSINVGGSELKNVPVMICDPPQAQMLKKVGQHYDGILGRSFFNKFKITLDYRSKQIKLTPN